jgi:hypothetical protein
VTGIRLDRGDGGVLVQLDPGSVGAAGEAPDDGWSERSICGQSLPISSG